MSTTMSSWLRGVHSPFAAALCAACGGHKGLCTAAVDASGQLDTVHRQVPCGEPNVTKRENAWTFAE
ncbi:hypothetical protein DYB30_005443 [Aphanomyces astaci]|uniref:Uncharacterized protein n=1 Tax=Aphanomyces astaci TaxID=112090 RepID=A0A397DUY9_APHAT|nr:hypothetical protein DYB30_005443 [Aphanomyces astaci]